MIGCSQFRAAVVSLAELDPEFAEFCEVGVKVRPVLEGEPTSFLETPDGGERVFSERGDD